MTEGPRDSAFQAVVTYMKGGASLFYSLFLHPRSADEDVARREYILNVLLVCAIFISFCSVLTTSYGAILSALAEDPFPGFPPVIVFGIFGIFASLLYLSRAGYVRLSSYVLIALYLIPMHFASLKWGADLPQGIAVYILLIMMTSILIGVRQSIFLTIYIGVFLSVVVRLASLGILVPDGYWRAMPFSFPDVIAMLAIFLVIAAVSGLASQEIERSLHRALISEAALKAERDLLEVKVEERTRELRKTQMEQISQLQRFVEFGRLASGVFHDLASPVTALSINLEMLGSDKMAKENAHLVNAAKMAQRLQDVISGARRHLRAQDTVTTFRVRHEIEKMFDILSYSARKSDVTLELTCDHDLRIHGNVIRFDQVLMNLVTNAIDACMAKKDESSRHVFVRVSELLHEVLVEVEDTGIGIKPEDRKKIFEPFFTTKPLEEGTGIGLSMCHEIVTHDLKGSIAFESTYGQGTTFSLKVPKYEAQGGALQDSTGGA